ncbi:MAG: glutamine--fructose-6-phosphate aminotransferase, partial [Solirubrobacteraceae bacterium]|nr:glutamine--fructose-6-phosphate aminotransferase [Solirubrobacteraceae bacterium]
MCGIVGYVGSRAAEELLLAGLSKLEYRGYDSAGISVMSGGSIEAVRAVGNLAQLQSAVEARQAAGGATATLVEAATIGIGHTRWATHGRVNEQNAHPHFDTADQVHVVVNGIVENYMELRERLIADGASFSSETDAEVIAHLVANHLDGDLEQAVRGAYGESTAIATKAKWP